jgi:hypothetical protein
MVMSGGGDLSLPRTIGGASGCVSRQITSWWRSDDDPVDNTRAVGI